MNLAKLWWIPTHIILAILAFIGGCQCERSKTVATHTHDSTHTETRTIDTIEIPREVVRLIEVPPRTIRVIDSIPRFEVPAATYSMPDTIAAGDTISASFTQLSLSRSFFDLTVRPRPDKIIHDSVHVLDQVKDVTVIQDRDHVVLSVGPFAGLSYEPDISGTPVRFRYGVALTLGYKIAGL